MRLLAACLLALSSLGKSASAALPRADPMAYRDSRISVATLPDLRDDAAREVLFSWVPVPGQNQPAPDGVLHLYAKAGPGAPLILVLPMTGDPGFVLSRSFCRFFSRHGLRCAYLERLLPDDKDLPKTLDGLFALPGLPPHSSMTARRALDALQALGEIRPGQKVGLAGVSLGAIDAAVVAATDPRVGALALLLGGGDVPYILSRIHGLSVEVFAQERRDQMRLNRWTLADFTRVMAERTWASDPLTYWDDPAWRTNKELNGSDVLMMNVSGDPAIPNHASDELYHAIAAATGTKPAYEVLHVDYLPGSWRHLGALLRLFYARQRMLALFRDVLEHGRRQGA